MFTYPSGFFKTNGLTPNDIGCTLWVDGADFSTITKDVSDNVSAWNDKSGNNYHLTQGNASYQPLYDGSNGIYFGALGTDYLINSSIPQLSHPFTIAVLVKLVSEVSIWQAVAMADGASNTGIAYYLGRFYGYAGSSLNYSVESVPTVYQSLVTTFNTTSSENYRNNILDGSGSVGSQPFYSGDFTLGHAAGNGAQGKFNGYITEAAIFNKILTTSERTGLYNYWAAKWL